MKSKKYLGFGAFALAVGMVLGVTGTPASADADVACQSVTIDDNTILLAADFSPNVTPWYPIAIEAGNTVSFSVTTFDFSHGPGVGLDQLHEIIWIELELADGSVITSGLTDDIPDLDLSIGPKNLGTYGPLASNAVQIRAVHGAVNPPESGITNSLTGMNVVVSCETIETTTTTEATTATQATTTTTEQATTTTTEQATTTSTTVPEATTSTTEATTTTEAVTTTTEAPTTTNAVSETTAGGGTELPRTGPSSTTTLLLLAIGFISLGVALVATSKEVSVEY